jgi:hypothetical protein
MAISWSQEGPGETKIIVKESTDFVDSLNLDQLELTMGIRIYPNTVLAQIAGDEGMISSQTNLLNPHFYLQKGLEEWLTDMLTEWRRSRSYVIA